MDLRESMQILYKRWRLILFTSIWAMFITGLYSCFFIDKFYISSATILISTYVSGESSSSLGKSPSISDKDTTKVYSVLAKSSVVLEQVVTDLSLEINIEKLKPKILVNPMGEAGLIQISVEYNDPYIAQRAVNSIIENLRTEASKANLLNTVYTIDDATLPLLPSRPNLVINTLLAFISASMASTIYIFVADYWDDSVKGSDDAKKRLGLTILGSIPFCTNLSNQHTNNQVLTETVEYKQKTTARKVNRPQNNLLMQLEGLQKINAKKRVQNVRSVVEAYKILRTNIKFAIETKALKVLVITSPGPAEGKTSVAVNLAMSTAQANSNVLLIDCNFRQPALHKFITCNNNKGLAEYLLERQHTESNVVSIKHNFKVIKSGTKLTNPSEMLNSTKLKDLINQVKSNYDIVIIDSPPAASLADASILSRLADGVILVVSVAKTKYREISQALMNLDNVSANILGIVVNNVGIADKTFNHK